MKFLTKFKQEADYQSFKGGNEFATPNVSYVTENNLVYFNPLVSLSNYEFVDLGLSVKWATCNIGATKPEESGLYFAWGEDKGYVVTKGNVQDEAYGVYTAVIKNADGTETTKTFAQDFSDYEHYENDNFVKYNTTDGLTTLENEDDGCYLAEKTMRMPTKEECEELINGTTSAWTTNYNGSGINGVVLTSNSNGNSIFVPAVGNVGDGVLDSFGLYGGFWSSSLFSGIVDGAFGLYFYEDYLDVDYVDRFGGRPLRAVCEI